MNRLLLALGALSLTTAMSASPASAEPPFPPGSGIGDFGVVDFCKYDVPTNHPDLTVGNCIGSRTTSGWTLEGWAQHVCFFMESERPEIFYSYYNSYVECVRDKADALIG